MADDRLQILDEINKAGFTGPTPIQSQAFPVALSGNDLVAVSATGSGKVGRLALSPPSPRVEANLCFAWKDPCIRLASYDTH